MRRQKMRWIAMIPALAAAGFSGSVAADELPPDVRAELAELRAEVAQLRAGSEDTWLNERRREEVKALIHEVLADAETRASFADGLHAGHDGKQFFLASEDGRFLLVPGGQVQFRYIANLHSSGEDTEDEGFQVRRAKVWFKGHVTAGPKWEYSLVLATSRSSGGVSMEDALIKTSLADGLKVAFGKYKLPFLREELMSSTKLLAVERGIVTEFFTLDRGEQVGLEYSSDMFKGWLSVNDGAQSEFSDIGADRVEFAVTARGELLLAGKWGDTDDVAAWSGTPFLATLGAAYHQQFGDGPNGEDADYHAWTVDGLVKYEGLSLYGAVMGGHINPDSSDADNRDMFGALAQAGYFIIPDELQPFVRYEWLDSDAADGQGTGHFLTFGGNYFFKKHSAKLTLDAVWVACLDGSIESNRFAGRSFGASHFSSGLGFAGDGVAEDTVVLRAQFQLLF